LRPSLHAELREHGRDVVLDGLFGEEETLGDLAVGEPLADQVEHLALEWSLYEPGYRTPAGTGTGLGFAFWS